MHTGKLTAALVLLAALSAWLFFWAAGEEQPVAPEQAVASGPRDGLWDAAIAAIAASDRYGGLELAPQQDLVPLEPDPRSGLFEFWHPPSGARPERDPATGRLRITGETGIAFVLIPGGTFTMGAQRVDPDGPNFDPLASEDELGPHAVTLEPFFLAKHELTQGQWLRLFGTRPSRFDALELGGDDHPVEFVTWYDCMEALPRAGLVLPTEAQWEYAARGGTTTPWWCGREASSIEAVGSNVLDRSAQHLDPMRDWDTHEPWDDGFVVHSPVGTFEPNPFGLHDVIGNVREWCRDVYAGYHLPVAPGDGLRQAAEGPSRVIRGGCFRFGSHPGRSAGRLGIDPLHDGAPLGVRPARALDPAGAPPAPGG